MLKFEELVTPGSCLNKADPYEPIFVLRAKDPVAAQAIRHWATMAITCHDAEKVEAALSAAEAFDSYRASLGDRLKPALPQQLMRR